MLPKSFGNLSNLVQLNLAYNKLAVVPISFKLLENLQVLDLYMVFTTPPKLFQELLKNN
jgi:Leucine-rich repeat (LRR) protein